MAQRRTAPARWVFYTLVLIGAASWTAAAPAEPGREKSPKAKRKSNQRDSAGLKDDARQRRLRLYPPSTQPALPEGATVRVGDWVYRAMRANPADGVPWDLMVTPAEEKADRWQLGFAGQQLPPLEMGRRRASGDLLRPGMAVPRGSAAVIEVPDVLWKQWFAKDMADVVGVHFHEVVSEDKARILFSLHKVPPDSPEGQPPADYKGVSGSRIEATLLTPLAFHLDQTIVARIDPLKKELVESRAQHELAHAAVSQDVFLAVLHGPQDWNVEACTGRRTKVAYYWRREEIGRTWREFRGGREKAKAIRTTVVLVPPTRWSLMLPVPPERVMQSQVDEFNESIVRVSQRFAEVDAAAQERFHGQHGAFEAAAGP